MLSNLPPQAEQYVKKHKWRKVWHKIVSALACVVVFCTTYALILPVITAEQTSYCGIKEHQHSDACYEMRLICGHNETEKSDYDVHTDACYEKVLVCRKEEHCHSLSCYSNPNADLETASDWESSVSGIKLTGKRVKDLIAIARSQLGYKESIQNYIVTECGEMNGITRYGQWYGDPYGDWSAMFISFCLNYADIPKEEIPYETNCQQWIEALEKEDYNLYRKAEDYTPEPGDLIFFNLDEDSDSDHVGIVTEVISATENTPLQVETIEGNTADRVESMIYNSDDERIIGYAQLPESF